MRNRQGKDPSTFKGNSQAIGDFTRIHVRITRNDPMASTLFNSWLLSAAVLTFHLSLCQKVDGKDVPTNFTFYPHLCRSAFIAFYAFHSATTWVKHRESDVCMLFLALHWSTQLQPRQPETISCQVC